MSNNGTTESASRPAYPHWRSAVNVLIANLVVIIILGATFRLGLDFFPLTMFLFYWGLYGVPVTSIGASIILFREQHPAWAASGVIPLIAWLYLIYYIFEHIPF